MKLFILYVSSILLLRSSSSLNLESSHQKEPHVDSSRPRRDVIEEEKFYNIQIEGGQSQADPWVPGRFSNDDPTVKTTTLSEAKKVVPLRHTTEKVTEKPTGRGARASNENWIKLPFPSREEESFSSNKPSGDLITSRMPRVDFVTQTKGLEAQESRTDKESIHRARHEEIRTEFVRPEETSKTNKPVYARQALYYPEENKRFFYDDRYYTDMYNRREPLKDYLYDRRRPFQQARANRYDDEPDRKPKRIIYYAHLPDVVRPAPSYRYPEPYRRTEDDYGRTPRYDYRFRTRAPYPSYRTDARFKDDRFRDIQRYRDLTYAGTTNKERKADEKVTAAPVLPTNDDKLKSKAGPLLQNYGDDVHLLYQNEDIAHKAFPDDEESFVRYDEPMIRTAIINDPHYQPYF